MVAENQAQLPDWVTRLGTAVWVTEGRCKLVWMNQAARALLDLGDTEVRGRICYELVRGQDEQGNRVCGPVCPPRIQADAGEQLEPLRMMVPGSEGRRHWIRLITIPLEEAGASYVVHCAVPEDRAFRSERYLERVAARTAVSRGANPGLTPREIDVLELLARDHDQWEIARRLHVSHVTVRNHVQHVLRKLQAHSMQEAVARYLLEIKPVTKENGA